MVLKVHNRISFNLLVESSILSALTTLKMTILPTNFSTNQGVTTLGLPTT
jgi:hypothetical protein